MYADAFLRSGTFGPASEPNLPYTCAGLERVRSDRMRETYRRLCGSCIRHDKQAGCDYTKSMVAIDLRPDFAVTIVCLLLTSIADAFLVPAS